MGFDYRPGLAALFLLVPFVILYLIRPKHRKLKIPSLMFLIDEKRTKTQINFLRNFLRDPVFLLQLLMLLSLLFAITQPFFFLNKQETATNTVIIMDGSASMQTTFNGKSRFARAQDEAGKYMQGRISVVLAAQIPETLVEHGGKLQAKNIIRTIEPTDTETNLAGAMFLAKDILSGRKGQVIVLSDFVTTSSEDNILVAKRTLNAQGINVKFVNLHSIVDNIGITDMDLTRDSAKLTIKNFADAAKEVSIQLVKDNDVKEEGSLKIAAQSIEPITFPVLPGVSQIRVNAKDGFLLDNVAHISSPLGDKIKVLMLTNEKDNFVRRALEAANIFEIEIREPPIVKAFELDHDVIIITGVSKTIVPSDVIDIKKYIENGNILIVTANNQLINLGLGDVLPVTLEKQEKATSINVKVINSFTKDKDFGSTAAHYKATPKDNSISFAVSDEDSPLLAQIKLNEGVSIYYGIFDKESEFKATEDYPIFWFTLLNDLLNTEDINDFNFRLYDKPQMRNSGVIELEGKKVAFNLLSEAESDISKQSEIIEEDTLEFLEKKFDAKAKWELAMPLLFLGVLLLFLELFWVKWRGDL